MGTIQTLLHGLTTLPPPLLYLILGLGAAVENIAPPVPADTFVLAGAVLAARGAADPWLVFLATWVLNVGAAAGVYGAARRHGRRFFKMPIARWLLREHQLEQIGGFYGRYGIPTIFASRFLPAWRAMVPVFAGVSGMRWYTAIPPMAVASAIWYGMLVYLGAAMGRNLSRILELLQDVNDVLLAVAAVLIVGATVWWWRSRHPGGDDG